MDTVSQGIRTHPGNLSKNEDFLKDFASINVLLLERCEICWRSFRVEARFEPFLKLARGFASSAQSGL
jgi:hypothetical protein